jgi:hypothetical protein
MSAKVLYTLILESGGGTYISQVTAESPQEALAKWAMTISQRDLSSWGITNQDVVQLSKDRPLLLENCINVWCVSASAKNGLMLLNIVATKSG